MFEERTPPIARSTRNKVVILRSATYNVSCECRSGPDTRQCRGT